MNITTRKIINQYYFVSKHEMSMDVDNIYSLLSVSVGSNCSYWKQKNKSNFPPMIHWTISYLRESTLNKCSFLWNAWDSSSKLISPDWSISVSWNRVAVNSANVSSRSSDGDCSKKQRSKSFISSKLIVPSPRKNFLIKTFLWKIFLTITIENFEEKFHFFIIICFNKKF